MLWDAGLKWHEAKQDYWHPKCQVIVFCLACSFFHFFSPDASTWVPSLTTNCQAKWVTHILSLLYRLAKLCIITYYHSSLFLECKWNGVCSRGDKYQFGRQLVQNINLVTVSVSLSNQCFLLLFLFVSFYGLIQILYLCHSFSPFVLTIGLILLCKQSGIQGQNNNQYY